MGLYTRKDYEADMHTIEQSRARSAGLRARDVITGFEYNRYSRDMDEAERRACAKLVSTRLVLQDKERMGKSQWFATVIGAKCDCRDPWTNGHKPDHRWIITRARGAVMCRETKIWVPVTASELHVLESKGVTIVVYNPQKKLRSDNLPDLDGEEYVRVEFEWKPVERAEALKLQQTPGWMVRKLEGRGWEAVYVDFEGGANASTENNN
jgi:hypothetical protein